jgi:hypothetical protein
MNWQDQLITIYLYICKHYQETLWVYSQRMSNYADLSFSDEEVIAIYTSRGMNFGFKSCKLSGVE